MTALEKIRDFIGSYPGADILRDFRVDFTDQIPANGGIFPSGLTEIDRKTDILGNTFTTMKKPVMTQSFDEWDLDSGNAAQQLIYQKAIVEQDAPALTNMDVMIAHFYSGSDTAAFAERYASCMVKPTSLGGEGGGNMAMPTDVTYGGERTVGTVTKGSDGSVTFSGGATGGGD